MGQYFIKNLSNFVLETFDKKAPTVSFGLFGGEPLMNWKFTSKFMEYARKQFKFKHSYYINTNCIFLDSEKIDFLNHFLGKNKTQNSIFFWCDARWHKW